MSASLKPIRTGADHAAALAELEQLWGAPAGSPEGDRLEVLSILIEAYEAQHFARNHPDPIDAILFRMNALGLKRKDLEPMIGTRGRVAEILNRRRPLSIEMIRKLHEALEIPAEVLIRQTKIMPPTPLASTTSDSD